jgi:hypothetical protein
MDPLTEKTSLHIIYFKQQGRVTLCALLTPFIKVG